MASPTPKKSGPSGLAIACTTLVLISLVAMVSHHRRDKIEVGDTTFSMGDPDSKGSDKQFVKVTTHADGSTVTVGDPEYTLPPRWVPSYPAAQAQSGGVQENKADTISGTYLAKTKDAPEKVKDYFESTLQADGFETKVTSSNANGEESAVITATKDDGKREITITASTESGNTNLIITYQGPK